MAYEKHTWENGELITAEKLNHMEDGIESSGGGGGNYLDDVMWVNITTQDGKTYSADKTWNELYEHLMTNGKPVGARSGWRVISINPTMSFTSISFTSTRYDNQRIFFETYTINNDDTCSYIHNIVPVENE